MPKKSKSGQPPSGKAAEAPALSPGGFPPFDDLKGAPASGNGDKKPSFMAGLDQSTQISPALGLRALLSYIGEDPDREGLKDTPGRVLKAWRETWGSGYRNEPPVLRCFAEEGVDYDEMIVVRSIQFYSTCEHHLAPFFGTCDIGYLPKKKKGVVGLSKLARVVDHFSRRLQVQERLTAEIAGYLRQLSPDIAVRMKARHFCMCSRGVMQPDAVTTTTVLRGRLKNAAPRAEFLVGS